MSLEKTLKRVRDLIALTSSDREEEARTAAFQACKLIREHKLDVIGARSTASSYRTRPPGEPARPGNRSADRGSAASSSADYRPPPSDYYHAPPSPEPTARCWTGAGWTYQGASHSRPADPPPPTRESFATNTSILSPKQFSTAVSMAYKFKANRDDAIRFFETQERTARTGDKTAAAYMGILKEIQERK